jgi:hypothetical protein
MERFRVSQAPSYTGSAAPTGVSGALTPEEMKDHIKTFIPVWAEVATNQDYPLNVEILGKRLTGEWHMATRLSPRTLRPTLESWPTLEDLGLVA